MSAGSLIFVAALVVSATGAFFSDTETSTGNTFSAGALDLQIDNTSYATDCVIPGLGTCTGALAFSSTTSWTLRDLTIEKFFNFIDLKPGDIGEDTISLHVQNDAWICAEAELTTDADNDITEPEDEVALPANDGSDGTVDGDLDSDLNFAFWVDDGNNVFETDETVFLSGPLSNIDDIGQFALADSEGSILPNEGPIPGGTTFYIGKIWCYGELTPDPETGVATSSNPLLSGTGWICDGSAVGNIGQTDSVVGDLTFYAEQSRNNDEFTCGDDEPEPEVTTLTLAKTVFPALLHPDNAYTLTASSTNTATVISGTEGQPSVTNAPVTPGVYTLSETSAFQQGATITWSCVGNAVPELDNGDGTATVTIGVGENVGCDVTNTYEQAPPAE